jgi:hypothetical protein
MNWKDEAKREIRNYKALKQSIPNIKERILSIQAQKTSLQSSSDSTPVQNGGNKYEDRLLDLIVLEKRLRLTLKADQIRIDLIERGLSVLSETERDMLLEFADNRPSEAVEILRDRTGYERAQIYRLYDHALYRFTLAEYGIPEF